MTAGASPAAAGRGGKTFPILLGLALAAGLQLIPVPEGLTREAWATASLAVLMAVWWATEAIPIPATSLLPLVVLPLAGVLTTKEAGAPYANPTVLLLMGGFVVAMALERWSLHARIALEIVARAGSRPRLLILGFMVAAALLSMWISNTATTLMMIPIALSVAHAESGEGPSRRAFTVALVLGVAYAASIGGVATPIGTPTNLIAMGFLAQGGQSVSFAQWSALGLPAAALMIPTAWFILTRLAFRIDPRHVGAAAAAEVKDALAALGRITAPEVRVAITFATIATAWMLREPLVAAFAPAHVKALSGTEIDAVIAIAGAVAFFLIPAGGEKGRGHMLMDWETAVRLPWGVLLLFGGGISLATAIKRTGLAEWIGQSLSLMDAFPPLLVAFALVVLILALTELTSNVATVTAFMPVIGALALETGIDPVLLAVPAAIAGSCAFMLPVATAPNAIVYATGEVTMRDMIQAGFRLNIAAAFIVTATAAALAPLVF